MTDHFEEAKNLFLEGLDFLRNENCERAEQKFLDALVLAPDRVSVLTNLSAALLKQGKIAEAKKYAQRSIELDPGNAEGWMNLGQCLAKENRPQEALMHSDKAIALNPRLADAWSNHGCILRGLHRFGEALAACEKALRLRPDMAEAWANRGRVLREVNQLDEALVAYENALTLKPDMPYLHGAWLHTKMHLCDWMGLQEAFDKIRQSVEASKTASAPFSFIATPASPVLQKRCAEIHVSDQFPTGRESIWTPEPYAHDRIRLGYFSADFHKHATAYLMAELFEKHDRSRFELIGFSFGSQTKDEMRFRLEAAFDRFIDVRDISDADVVRMSRELEIDIAIDLKGFTQDARTGVFANRVAPIQVNYLGYPGTMGASFIDYLIADTVLIPEMDREYYSEKIAYLPDSYQVNDSSRKIAELTPRRSEAGLPEHGFVFCCFNNNYKITPDLFDVWMRLLYKTPGSVLWLFEGNPAATANLRTEVENRGISADRLVFAKRVDLPEHLARHRLADLFLDTLYCNAHTTASDALWAGLPVLTCLGNAFAGRVAGSLLNAIGLPELITHSLEEYEALALELARNPEKLPAIRQKLMQNRTSYPLFNSTLFAKNIETAYTLMHERHLAGLAPDHVYVQSQMCRSDVMFTKDKINKSDETGWIQV